VITNDNTDTKASDLIALDNKTSITVNAIAVTAVIGTAIQVSALASADITMAEDYNAKLTEISAANDVNTVAADTTGVVTATVAADTASNLNTNLSSITNTDIITLTVNGSVANATDLISLDSKTSVDITIDASTVSGTLSDIQKIYINNKDNYISLGDENITVEDVQTANDINSILDKTTGVVTATVTADTASNLNANLSNATQFDALSLTVNGTSATANDLLDLNDKTSVDIQVDATSIIGNLEDVNTVYGEDGFSNLTSKTVDLSSSGDFEMIDFSNIDNGEIDSLNFANNDDSVSFSDKSSFDSWADKFKNIDFGSSSQDSISFDDAVNADLDFSKISNLENLNLSNENDNITLSKDEPENINGNGGNDTFALDFSNIGNFNLDGGANSDEVNVTGSASNLTQDGSDFGTVTDANFTNIESLNLSNLDFSGFGDEFEFEFTDSLLTDWLSGSGTTNFTLKLNSSDAEHIKFTGENTNLNDGNKVYDGQGTGDSGNIISDGSTYDLGDTTLTIDFIDVP
jgi:hypothetical protein